MLCLLRALERTVHTPPGPGSSDQAKLMGFERWLGWPFIGGPTGEPELDLLFRSTDRATRFSWPFFLGQWSNGGGFNLERVMHAIYWTSSEALLRRVDVYIEWLCDRAQSHVKKYARRNWIT